MESTYVMSLVKRALAYPQEGQLLLHVGGGPGSGKSTLLREITAVIAREVTFDNVMVMAPTRISANNVYGRTVRSAVNIPRGLRRLARFRSRWHNLKWLICDDVSMISAELLGDLENLLPTESESGFFGNKNVVLFGDVLGLRPIKGYQVFLHPVFSAFRYVHLGGNLRCTEPALVRICTLQRMGELRLCDLKPLLERRRSQLSAEELSLFEHAVHLSPSKCAVNQMNSVNADVVTQNYVCVDRLVRRCAENETSNAMYFTRSGVFRACLGFAPQRDIKKLLDREIVGLSHTVKLFVGAVVVLRADLDELLVANVTGIVLDLETHPLVSFETRCGPLELRVAPVSAIDEVEPTVYIRRTQLPLLQTKAFTVHSVQGCTFDRVVIHLPRMFTASLAITALSRVRSLRDLVIDDRDTKLPNIIKNGPSQEALSEAKRLMIIRELLPEFVQKLLKCSV